MYRGMTHPRTFTPGTALTWLQQHAQRRSPGKDLARLQQARLVSIVRGEEPNLGALSEQQKQEMRLQLLADAPKLQLGQPLNVHFRW